MSNKVIILFIAFFLSWHISSATTRKVLFIGNSYTYTNNMPLILKTLATNIGDTLIYDESDPGGYTFALHCTNATTIAKIFSQQWDIVVLQEQSQLPSFPPAEVDTEVYPYAHKLDSMIHVNNPCTQTMFLMTWGHANGDPDNCPFYPVICTYAGMQARLRESYLEMALTNNAIVAPVGVAFKIVMDSFPAIGLFMTDSSHPVVQGSYLEACVLYSSIFHKRTLNSTYISGLTAADAHTLRQISDRVVFDSLIQWQQYGHYPYAGFMHSITGSTANFTGSSLIAANNYWGFGDGAHDTAANPVHTYAGIWSYAVSHTVSTGCFTETLTDTIHLGAVSAGNLVKENSTPIIIRQQGNGNVTFEIPVDHDYKMLAVYNASGVLVKQYILNVTSISDQFVPGIYYYRVYSGGQIYSGIQFAVY